MAARAGTKGAIALIGAFVTLATMEWAGVTGFLRSLGTYLPPHRLWVWWIPIGVFGLTFAYSSWFWFIDHGWRRKYEETQLQTQQVALNERQGFRTIAHLSLETGENVPVRSNQPAQIIQVGPAYEEEGIRYQAVKITEPSGKETEFGYTMLYDRASWVRSSATHVLGTDGNPVHIKTAIANANIERMTKRSARVMCFGFASSERRFSAVENEGLSDDRAINMCEALVVLGYVSEDRGQEAIGVGFGEARGRRSADTSRERIAIIIGIISSPRKPAPQTFLNAIRLATADASGAHGLDLSKYSRFRGRIRGYLIMSADGEYSGYRNEAKWRDHTALLYSDVEPILPIKDDAELAN